MNLAEIVVCEIESNRSLKVIKLFAESVRQTSQSAAVHSQSKVLAFDVRRSNPAHVRHSRNNCSLNLNHFNRAIPTGCVFVEIREAVGFYNLSVVNLAFKITFNRVWIG